MNRPDQLDVWILAGQSNMEGAGELSESLSPSSTVWNFSSAGVWEIAKDPLHRLWESSSAIHRELLRGWLPEDRQGLSDQELGIEQAQTRTIGAGLGIAFGQTMVQAGGLPIGLVPCAHGGTSLGQWSPRLKSKGSSLYGSMIDRALAAGGNLKGVLWYQGEADGWSLDDSNTYADRLKEFIFALRADLNQPTLPFLSVQIGKTTLDSPNSVAWEKVRHAIGHIPLNVPNTAVTTAIDLALNDCIHLNTHALHRLGRRLARLATELQQCSGTAPSIGRRAGPRVVGVERITVDHERTMIRLRCEGVSGGWQPSDNMLGFDYLGVDGNPHPIKHVYNAARNSVEPSTIDVHLNLRPDSGESVVYGYGLRPSCNVVDAADMALCGMRIFL